VEQVGEHCAPAIPPHLTKASRRRPPASAPLPLPGAPEARRSGVPGQTGTMVKGASPKPRRASHPRWPRGLRRPRERSLRSVDRGTCRQGREPRNRAISRCRRAPNTRQATRPSPVWRGLGRPGGVAAPWPARKQCVRDPGGPVPGLGDRPQARLAHPRGTAVRYGGRESDSSIVPMKRPTKGSPTRCRTSRPRPPRRRSGREGNGPRATRASNPESGRSAGELCDVRWPGDARQQRRTGNG